MSQTPKKVDWSENPDEDLDFDYMNKVIVMLITIFKEQGSSALCAKLGELVTDYFFPEICLISNQSLISKLKENGLDITYISDRIDAWDKWDANYLLHFLQVEIRDASTRVAAKAVAKTKISKCIDQLKPSQRPQGSTKDGPGVSLTAKAKGLLAELQELKREPLFPDILRYVVEELVKKRVHPKAFQGIRNTWECSLRVDDPILRALVIEIDNQNQLASITGSLVADLQKACTDDKRKPLLEKLGKILGDLATEYGSWRFSDLWDTLAKQIGRAGLSKTIPNIWVIIRELKQDPQTRAHLFAGLPPIRWVKFFCWFCNEDDMGLYTDLFPEFKKSDAHVLLAKAQAEYIVKALGYIASALDQEGLDQDPVLDDIVLALKKQTPELIQSAKKRIKSNYAALKTAWETSVGTI